MAKLPKASIQNRIRALRFEHGEMTQQALADQIGVTRQTVNAIEGNKYSPSLEVAFRIAKVFDRPLEEVFQYAAGEGG
ncbi:helix-turn-helix transcriptional regulator [bacterium]|jgi:putative transcriptional regulator|nr:helix-turn-helix transcriptional regulator [Verrucomicrobiales bacterium]MDC3255726.1 helix-turn-helix transcriptional regulator [bacterium]MDF1788081.1 helix-turn-helix transcriptional regulator [Verrucomicrobiales bacterium]NCF88447.1 helix-turn-helix domain-containing protein [Verrucomicrobiaceae bacterium]NCF92968.1 helix-turn-helix domain-containing protein [Verrucomicrobiaceae bacterium]